MDIIYLPFLFNNAKKAGKLVILRTSCFIDQHHFRAVATPATYSSGHRFQTLL
jgi:hypothetical protein